MKALKIFFLAGFIGYMIAIIYGIFYADLFHEGGIMLDTFWGTFTLIDIYGIFIVFYLWILYKETKAYKKILWFFLIMLGGGPMIFFYVYLALLRSDDEIKNLLVRRHDDV